ncbi:MAG TPA: hypothetical protein VKT82_17930 [Ktedonobacterales bacterium]|nr:hypothetical protein [Ktedonobacterales bacterium]
MARGGIVGWRVIKKRIGRAGSVKQRTGRQREWDRLYGAENWAIGYVIDGAFVLQEEALETIYYRSYEEHFRQHPADLAELIALAKKLTNPHAEATTGVDLQVPAIMDYLERHQLTLQGNEVVDIGSWQGRASHPISVRLSPLQVKVVGNPRMTLEQFWQEEKCLAVWEED